MWVSLLSTPNYRTIMNDKNSVVCDWHSLMTAAVWAKHGSQHCGAPACLYCSVAASTCCRMYRPSSSVRSSVVCCHSVLRSFRTRVEPSHPIWHSQLPVGNRQLSVTFCQCSRDITDYRASPTIAEVDIGVLWFGENVVGCWRQIDAGVVRPSTSRTCAWEYLTAWKRGTWWSQYDI